MALSGFIVHPNNDSEKHGKNRHQYCIPFRKKFTTQKRHRQSSAGGHSSQGGASLLQLLFDLFHIGLDHGNSLFDGGRIGAEVFCGGTAQHQHKDGTEEEETCGEISVFSEGGCKTPAAHPGDRREGDAEDKSQQTAEDPKQSLASS